MSAAGQEATIVGVTSVMRPDDYLIGTYRAQPRGAQVGASPECAETLRSFCHELPAATTGVA